MLEKSISRRNFLKLAALSASGLALQSTPSPNHFDNPFDNEDIARVAARQVSVYKEPSDKSKILYQHYRDDLVNIYYEVISDKGPTYNPLWYRVWRGYLHSAHTQKVQYCLNPVQSFFPKTGQLAEVTVPYTQSMRFVPKTGWTLQYRLYYQSVHWIIGVDEGPDGEPWYRVLDELLDNVVLNASAAHFRIIQPEELAPITPEIPLEHKYIEISLAQQKLWAYEYDKMILESKISSGLPETEHTPGVVPTNTPTGNFNVQIKLPSKHMGDGILTSDIEAYVIPGVPWCSFFEPKTGVAIHGTYWHTNYGTPMSHGCINVPPEVAKWVYRWTLPITQPGDRSKGGFGTQVIVH